MTTEATRPWWPEQVQRLQQTNAARTVDIHCHLLPGMDDGPSDDQAALALAEALARDGITTVVATPHQLGRYDRLNKASVVRTALERLGGLVAAAEIPLEILPGGDVRVDERLPILFDEGEVGTIGDLGAHMLLELPHELFIDPRPTIELLQEREIQAIVTHPERHPYLVEAHGLLAEWVEAGAVIQITAGSLLGDFGRRAYDQAWRLVDDRLACLVATDAHDVRRRPPRMTAALAALSQEVDSQFAQQLCIEHPYLVSQGRPIAFRRPH